MADKGSSAPSPAPGKEVKSSYFGMKVDWEMKVLGIVSVFAAVKFLQGIIGVFLTTALARLIFLVGHVAYTIVYLNTTNRISKSTSRSAEEKAKVKEACFSIYKGLMIRAVVVILIHWRTKMLPPLVVTVIMGFC